MKLINKPLWYLPRIDTGGGTNYKLNTKALSYSEQMKHPLWLKKQEEIFIRDDYTCQICGSKIHRLQVHHLCYFPGMMAWEYDDELMKSVCIQHHEILTYDMPKVAGLIAFEALKGGIDLNVLFELIKYLENGKNTDYKTGILATPNFRKAG